MDVVELAKKLISIPSYLDFEKNENKVADFLFSYLSKHNFLSLKKQQVKNDRYNIVASTSGVPKLLIFGHLDTVQPQAHWDSHRLMGSVENGKLYGLGSYDMKGGVSAFTCALDKFKSIKGLSILYYCDEEYDFLGMKKFVEETEVSVGDIAIGAEYSDLKIWDSHRGLVEITFSIKGKTGHASDQSLGKSAIDGINNVLYDLKKWLRNFNSPILGPSSLNISFIRGGYYLGSSSNDINLGREGNIIPDYAEAVVEIRSASSELKAESVVNWIKDCTSKYNLEFIQAQIRHDLDMLETDRTKLAKVVKALKPITNQIDYVDPSKKGYGDGQLLQKKFGVPVIYVGPIGENAHGVDENITIKSLEDLTIFYENIIEEYCEVEKL
jgi:acetylornithine deacetylase